MKTPIIILALLLAGCYWTGGEAVDKAIEVCKPHGGVKFILGSTDLDSYHVECKDGTTIEGTVK